MTSLTGAAGAAMVDAMVVASRRHKKKNASWTSNFWNEVQFKVSLFSSKYKDRGVVLSDLQIL